MIDTEDIKSLLIVRPDYLGDTLLFLPKLREIRRALPNAMIDFAAMPVSRELIERTGWVDHVVKMEAREVEAFPPRRLLATIRRLRHRSYDLVMATSIANFNTGLLLTLTRSRYLIGYASGYNKFVFTKTFPFDFALPIYLQDWDLVESLGGKVDTRLVPYPTTQEEVSQVEQWMVENGVRPGRFAVLHHTSTYCKKMWSATSWRELARTLRTEQGISVVLTGVGQRADAVTDGVEGVHDTTGKLTLGQLGGLMQRACLVVSLDTGPLHMAAAIGIPTVGLYAVKGVRDRWGYGSEFRHIVGIVADSCDDDGMKISVEAVMESIRMLLSQRRDSG
jgi:ADP-heptose:LPS heptosyltransferase